ncbi:MAG: biotin-dependent carboxyltransferase family protein [Actinobacteria bacterium]|nr:biotin-dependent carboxyltransferase family protein [Actinomycetota bacterium]
MIEIVSWGVAGAVRDGGRPGLAHLGRSRGGAVDLDALRLGNRLLGNDPDAAGIETSGGLTVRTSVPVMVAITGSPADLTVVDGPPVGWGAPAVLPAGAMLRVGRLLGGARTYVAVRGGLSVDDLGVRAGPDPGTPASHEVAAPRVSDHVVRVWRGPRLDWFVPGAWEQLTAVSWEVRADSDRVGVRLAGPRLERAISRELPSEGLVEGSIQVPPDGQPIVMLADHPVTGGYPVIAVVDPASSWVLAQAPPGTRLRFRPVR